MAQAFWNWVQQEEERLYGMVVDDAVGLVEELCDMLQREHAGLVVEVYHGPSSEDEPAERPAGMVGASGDARRPRGMASRCYHAGDELRPRAWAALLRDGARRQLLLGAPSRRREWTAMS